MTRSKKILSLQLPAYFVLTFILTSVTIAETRHDHSDLKLGHVEFPTSASGEAQEEFIVGLLALYNVWYGEARPHFQRAQEIDPEFGMAYWGEAMTYDNALLIRIYPGSEELGTQVVARMDELDAKGKLRWTELERGYADAVRERFHEGLDWNNRRRAYAHAMTRLSEQYPDNDNVTVFKALAIMALPSFVKTDPKHVFHIAGELEEVYERQPEHPGAVLYLAHLYEDPVFALMGLRQARILPKVAPSAAHGWLTAAYVYVRVGMWAECADMAEAAYRLNKQRQQRMGHPVHARVFRTLLWAIRCNLNAGQRHEAQLIMEEIDAVEAEIIRRGEAWGEFPEWSEQIRAAYKKSIAEEPR